MASIEDENRYLREQVSYEIMMMDYALGMLNGCKSGKRRNMYYECFAIHARNLRDFILSESKNNLKASHYYKFKPTKDNEDAEEAIKLITKLDVMVFHLAKEDRDGSITLGDALKMYKWIVQELQRFGKDLPKAYKPTWDGSVSTPKWRPAIAHLTEEATNQFTNTASFSPQEALAKGSAHVSVRDGVFSYRVKG